MRGKKALGAGALVLALMSGVGWAQAADSKAPAEPQAAPAAPAAIDGYQLVRLPNQNVPNFQRRVAYCPPGKVAISGGAEAQGSDAILVGSFPTDDGRGWIGLGRQNRFGDVGVSVYVICANR
ncbi:hypothetical protein E3E14_02635 [Streptomyces sp. ICN441]|uniref:Secreted protein n=1 Tax=Streptomyces tirandamycinicus TaxID=2174846 RepID=A0A2S1STM6_9ACTN|nr:MULTISPECIES: hypothetical protein [Streptomyces]AWI29759.1 hypothetical protein DDW44_13880 [Streptomyces tirandamycinicus]TFE57690.1 hypothetical protein E3E14_02635 [Streptomyces sp. ICN441]